MENYTVSMSNDYRQWAYVTPIVLLFTSYCIAVSYFCSYGSSYYPNMNMFINFVFNNYDGHDNFVRYIKSVRNLEHFTNGSSEDDIVEGLTPSPIENNTKQFRPDAVRSEAMGRIRDDVGSSEATGHIVEVSWPLELEKTTSEIIANTKNLVMKLYNKFLLYFYTKGNRVKFYRNIYK